jgi:hypothetical protein
MKSASQKHGISERNQQKINQSECFSGRSSGRQHESNKLISSLSIRPPVASIGASYLIFGSFLLLLLQGSSQHFLENRLKNSIHQ